MPQVPYSGNLSWVKNFGNFAVLGQFAKVLTAKIFIEYRGVIINGRAIVVSRNSQKSNFQKFAIVFTRERFPLYGNCLAQLLTESAQLLT